MKFSFTVHISSFALEAVALESRQAFASGLGDAENCDDAVRVRMTMHSTGTAVQPFSGIYAVQG